MLCAIGSPAGFAPARTLNSKLKSAARLLKQAVEQKIMPAGTTAVDVMRLTGGDLVCKLQVASPNANVPISDQRNDSMGQVGAVSAVESQPTDQQTSQSGTTAATQPKAPDSQPQGVRTYVMLPLDTVREGLELQQRSA